MDSHHQNRDTAAQLEYLRQEVIKTDEQILQLISARLKTTQQIGQIKKAKGWPIRNSEVEKQLKEHYLKMAHQYGLHSRLCLRLHQLLVEESRAAQKTIKG